MIPLCFWAPQVPRIVTQIIHAFRQFFDVGVGKKCLETILDLVLKFENCFVQNIEINSIVELQNLDEFNLNGLHGKVQSFNEGTERWEILIFYTREIFHVKTENLRQIEVR